MTKEFELSYLIHTNRELGMMLRGEKPLSAFAVPVQNSDPVFARYLRMFERHCEAGRFIKRDIEHPNGAHARSVYFALPGADWRIDEMITLRSGDDRWTLEHERREGELLGYSDSQNDEWIEFYKRHRIQS